MPKNILVIDDEQLVTESINKLLKKEGYNVTVAGNGADAIKIVEGNANFDLIIADIRMPEMNGIEIIKKLRGITKESVPEILITGYASDDNLKEAQELKVADYIYKPFDIRQFMEVVRKNLGK